ncbi:hypothetical protein BV25DRAFT_767507 [Artomyces pyxidatus]|uniref:Uncharacterized protein n=1 Tax=Artomyces pyxidatus TaxID=48021 RepID=A0ACB8T094_9AGAM|nr:hypothetical protein BV25DRAFT_767507 [Artomyces pyxidatus]
MAPFTNMKIRNIRALSMSARTSCWKASHNTTARNTLYGTGSRASLSTKCAYRIKCFFDPEHVLVESHSRVESRDASSHVGLHIVPFRAEPSAFERPFESVAARPSYCFLFPEFMQQHSIQISTKVAPWRTTDPSAPGHFYSNPSDRLFSVEVAWASNGGLHNQHFYIPSTTFSSYIRSHPMTESSTSIHVPWDAWGRMGAHLTYLKGQNSIRRPLCLSGMRSMHYDYEDAAAPKVVIFDFHPRRVARAMMLQQSGDTDITVLHGATLRDSHSEYEDFETKLPCIVTKMALPDGFTHDVSPLSYRRGLDRVYLCDDGLVFTMMTYLRQK